jgi:hypothetical protein
VGSGCDAPLSADSKAVVVGCAGQFAHWKAHAGPADAAARWAGRSKRDDVHPSGNRRDQPAAFLPTRKQAKQAYRSAEQLNIRHIGEERGDDPRGEVDSIQARDRVAFAVHNFRHVAMEPDDSAIESRRRELGRANVGPGDWPGCGGALGGPARRGGLFPPNYLHDSWLDYLHWDGELEP